MKRARLSPRAILASLGLASFIPYLFLLRYTNLRQHINEFEIAFLIAFLLYAAAVVFALKMETLNSRELLLIFLIAAGFQSALLFSRPALSDDMYRYVWDGRVQAHGISPYRYPPSAPQLEFLRDQQVWPSINRKPAVTIYPPAAELAFNWLWHIWPDSVVWFQFVMALSSLAAGWLLVALLKVLNRSPARALVYLWSPLLAFETAHSAHLEGLVLPLIVGAWLARARQKDILTGILLGAAAAMKLYPAILLPALWRSHDRRGRWLMPAAFFATVLAFYLPFVLRNGIGVVGFLPNYLREQFNISPLVNLLLGFFKQTGVQPNQGVLILTLVILSSLGIWFILKPAITGEQAVRRSIWLIGGLVLLSPNLFPWYLLWLLPLAAIFLEPGSKQDHYRFPYRADAWTGWWLFCGLIAISYTFFIRWRTIPAAQWGQFLPLYLFLMGELARTVKNLNFHRYDQKKLAQEDSRIQA